MDGVDLPVLSALQEVRFQIAVRIDEIVAALVVVLDLQVAVVKQALCDDEVMRLVAVGQDGCEPPRRQARCNDGNRECQAKVASGTVLAGPGAVLVGRNLSS